MPAGGPGVPCLDRDVVASDTWAVVAIDRGFSLDRHPVERPLAERVGTVSHQIGAPATTPGSSSDAANAR